MIRRLLLSTLLCILAGSSLAQGQGFHVEPHPPYIQGIPFTVTVTASDAKFVGTTTLELVDEAGATIGEPRPVEFTAESGPAVTIPVTVPVLRDADAKRTKDSYYKPRTVTVRVAGTTAAVGKVLPDWAAVAPPLIAIILAILFRQVLVALMLGLVAGVLIMSDLQAWPAFQALLGDYIIDAIVSADAGYGHAKIVVFSLLLGAMVGVISKSGGTAGIVHALTGRTSTRRSGQVATAGIGTAIFFDDYANCLIVGNTMRPITDRLRVSREKLAYLVDSTAAPVTSLVPLSTWVGAQVSYVADGLTNTGKDPTQAYSLIIQSIPYMFYPIFALFLVYFIAYLGRDAFTMLSAERRAHKTGKVLRDGAKPLAAGEEDEAIRSKEGKPKRAINAFLPVLTVVGVTIFGLIRTGWDGWDGATLGEGFGGFATAVRMILGNADSYNALLWASFAGLSVAIVLAWVQRILSLDEAMTAAIGGMKAMFLAMTILVLAWALGSVADKIHAVEYLRMLSETAGIEGGWFPLLVFGLAAATSFATGTAWGTMSILVPLMVPLSYAMAGSPEELAHPIVLGSIAACLGGAVFGDHCSPISDTTVLSSTASACDHIDHVRTQLPYALLGALFAGCAGYLPIAYRSQLHELGLPGEPIWYSLPLGLAVLLLMVRFLFRPVVKPGDAAAPALSDRPVVD